MVMVSLEAHDASNPKSLPPCPPAPPSTTTPSSSPVAPHLVVYSTYYMEDELEGEQNAERKGLKKVGKWVAHKDNDKWLDDIRGNLSLAATVIATITFQSRSCPLPAPVHLDSHSQT
ncbi:hypothetical protein DEO72_LG7g920 [Vigna unguiculata]|uniref:Uncharacterized protein n=1 Tax=Vigna unguiculata TaxID=3917 RepID=A0A4D6MI06_VIGUN|nr:hypothetical protein DEO72_LG7g920 [Vigna unguiculata]